LKLIRTKFPTRCKDCGKIIPKGDRANWAKGYGVTHPNCKAPETVNPAPNNSLKPRTDAKYDPSWMIDWPELKDTLKKFAFKGEFPQGMSEYGKQRIRSNFDHGGAAFHGGDIDKLKVYLTEGYRTNAIQGLAGLVPPIREKRRLRFGEEGDEFHYDVAMSGDENYMSYWTKREQIPGVRLSLELDASAGSSDALFAYQRWMAQAIYALESSGVDCEVEIFTLSRGLFSPQKKIARTSVRVKKSGEIADFAGFSAMMSPLAFRGIIFSCFSLQAQSMGISQRGYGSGVTDTWRVYYNSELHSIVADCDWTAHGFPEERMTEQLKAAIVQMKSDPH